jgi:hypothetical protein
MFFPCLSTACVIPVYCCSKSTITVQQKVSELKIHHVFSAGASTQSHYYFMQWDSMHWSCVQIFTLTNSYCLSSPRKQTVTPGRYFGYKHRIKWTTMKFSWRQADILTKKCFIWLVWQTGITSGLGVSSRIVKSSNTNGITKCEWCGIIKNDIVGCCLAFRLTWQFIHAWRRWYSTQ